MKFISRRGTNACSSAPVHSPSNLLVTVTPAEQSCSQSSFANKQVAAQEYSVSLSCPQNIYKGGKAATLHPLCLKKTNHQWERQKFIGWLDYNFVCVILRLQYCKLTFKVHVRRVHINSRASLMKTQSQMFPAFWNKHLSTLLPKITPISEQQVKNPILCCKALNFTVILGKITNFNSIGSFDIYGCLNHFSLQNPTTENRHKIPTSTDFC